MNVKFRMPKLSAEQIANPSGNGKSRGIVRELLLTTIATNLDHSGTRLELSESDTPPVHYQRRLENQYNQQTIHESTIDQRFAS